MSERITAKSMKATNEAYAIMAAAERGMSELTAIRLTSLSKRDQKKISNVLAQLVYIARKSSTEGSP